MLNMENMILLLLQDDLALGIKAIQNIGLKPANIHTYSDEALFENIFEYMAT